MITHTEENYLKAVYQLAGTEKKSVGTNAISEQMKTAAASVTDMIRKLAGKDLLNYEKYKGVTLTPEGNKHATQLIRKHRLWEVFLVSKLNFRWDQVHDIAEQLEHIQSDELIERLDSYLGNPRFDPHGDPIPNAQGKFMLRNQHPIGDISPGHEVVLVGVRTHETPFLEYLNSLEIGLGTEIEILEKINFDNSLKIRINKKIETIISEKVSQNLFVRRK
jgi:DtxR family Mn-dependent transcriptional regulator